MEWIWSAVSALAAIVTAIVAIWAVHQTASDAREKSQPMMVAELRQAEHADSILQLVVRNAGPTVARDVRVTFAPAIPRTTGDLTDNSDLIADRYATPISHIAPGSELVNTWWAGDYSRAADSTVRNRQAIGDGDYVVKIAYQGLGNKELVSEYRIQTMRGLLTSKAVSSDSVRGSLKAVANSLKDIVKKMPKA